MNDDWKNYVRRYGPSLFQIAWRILGNADDADEVVQEVFLQAYEFKSRNAVLNPIGLLKRMAVCRSLDLLRRRHTSLRLDDVVITDTGSGPESRVISQELESRLRDAICELPSREAEVFTLRYFDELTNQEIAEALEMTSVAVATAIYKARHKLSRLLADLIKGASS